MRSSRILIPLGLFLGLALVFTAYFWQLSHGLEGVSVENVSPLPLAEGERSLPFFELMSPLPRSLDHWLLPKLEYAKGPPDRYLERLQILVVPPKLGPKERIVYYGRRTREDWHAPAGFDPKLELSQYYKAAFLLALAKETKIIDSLPWFTQVWARYNLLSTAQENLQNVKQLSILDQAGTPAFLFRYKTEAGSPERAKLWFFRRNSLYQVELRADTHFASINPEDFFRKSFLSENRSDAIGFVTSALSQIRFDANQADHLSAEALAFPMALLTTHLSLNPASIDTYFHFAGLSALLFKSPALDSSDVETLDILRSNVLAAELFAKDIQSDSPKTAEIGHLARSLVRGFQQ